MKTEIVKCPICGENAVKVSCEGWYQLNCKSCGFGVLKDMEDMKK